MCFLWVGTQEPILQIHGLVQERRNSIANALELRLSCTNPSKWFNPLRLSDAFVYYGAGQPLVQVMASCLFGAKPLSVPMMAHFYVVTWEQISVDIESK